MDYFNEVNTLIEDLEINKRVREYKDNSETLETYLNIGKILYEVVKEKNKYGNGYKYSELMKMKQYYSLYPNFVTLSRISWSHIVAILPIKSDIFITSYKLLN